MSTKSTTLKNFQQELREQGVKFDPWGTVMSAFFQIAAHTYEKGDCPAEWQYKPGAFGNHIDDEDSLTEFLRDLSYDELILLGNYSNRICDALKRKEMDY